MFDLAGLDVGAGPVFVPGPGGPSTDFAVGGAVADPAVFNEAALAARGDLLTQTVTYSSGAGQVTDTYTGALLWDLLEDAGVLTDPAVRNDILGFYAVATGSDGYRAVYSLGEIAPGSGGEPIMVAFDDALGQLGPDGTAGFARMVVPGDNAGGRYVSNLVGIEVIDIDTDLAARADSVWG